jgi:UDP-glucose 4-epimerase
MSDRKRFLVVGGAGFIGSHLINRLMKRGFSVTVFDNMSTGSLSNLDHHLKKKSFQLVKADICDVEELRGAVRRSDVVFHLAAAVDVQRSIKDPSETYRVNVGGVLNILEACRRADTDLLVYASSCALYGDRGKVGIKEDVLPRPISPYAVSKFAAEEYCLSFHRTYGLPTISLRFFNVYGPRQRVGPYAGVVVKFVQKLLSGKRPTIYGDGEQSRDFVNVQDVVDSCMICLEGKEAIGQAINIGTGRATTINSLAGLLIRLTGKSGLNPLYRQAREGEIQHSRADIRLAKRLLGYVPRVTLKEGLRDYVAWFLASG